MKRDKGYADRLRAYKVVLDDNIIGEIKDDQQVEFDIAPGKHHLNLKIDWCRSNTVDFLVNKDAVEFECGSNLRGYKIVLVTFYVLFMRKDYIWLKIK